MRTFIAALIVLVQVFSGVAGAVTMETVPVGNTGNANDTHGDGYGGVDYEYNIGKYEVTAGQYRDFLNAVAASDPYGLYNAEMNNNTYGCQITQNGTSGSYTYNFDGRPSGNEADWADRPVNYVSWGDAARFANWLHNGQPTGTLTGTPAQDVTLTEDGSYDLNGALSAAALIAITRETDATWVIPAEDEWYKAAYYDTVSAYFDYPTGSDTAPTAEAPPGLEMINGSANFGGSVDPIGTTPVGAYLAKPSTSPYGTFDQGGNLWEWNETAIGSSRGMRGGVWVSTSNYLAASYRGSYNPTNGGNATGFRVASVADIIAIPEPSTLILLLLGAAGLFACARRRRR